MDFVRRSIVRGVCLLCLLNLIAIPAYTQEFGEELIPSGTFGTIETIGKNGDGKGGKSLYPGTESAAGVYYQPTTKVWSGWWPVVLKDVVVNPKVTIGHAIDNRTTYNFGMTETWSDGNYFLPRASDQANSSKQVPHGPNNGYYVIATSTGGMYQPPLLPGNNWYGPLYDKYETDFQNPKNYFMVVNADLDQTKIYYKEEVNVEPGRLYRLSVDVARLNRDGAVPSIAFVVSTSPNNLSTISPMATKSVSSRATWENLYFDYLVPSDVSKVYVAFRNNVSGGIGNDLAIDNLSMQEIITRIYVDKTATDPCSVGMTLRLQNAEYFSNRTISWQKKNPNGVWVNIPGASSGSYLATTEGLYRVVVYINKKGSFYSANEIRVTKDASCTTLLPLTANDDAYQTLPGVEITGNVLTNDVLASTVNEPASMAVVNYVVGGVTYSVGRSASLYDGTTLLGVITLEADGKMIFKSVPGIATPKQMPSITYNIQSSYGTSASASISINIVSQPTKPITVTYDASCIQCPIYVKLSSGGLVSGETYSLYRGSQLIGSFDKRNTDITFNETVSGTLTYSVRNSASNVVATFTMEVHPASAEWRNDPSNSVWQQSSNWKTTTGSGYPTWCTDVVIPGNTTTYPLLVNGDAARDITFKDGASVGQIQKLKYRKAFVEANPARNRWYMLSAPLRYMYSADLHGDASWTDALSPKIFMMYFDVANNVNPDGRAGYSIGNFSRPFANLEEALSVGKSYTLWLNGKGNGMSYDDKNFPTGTPYKFPRLVDGQEPQYSYHNSKTGAWTTPVVGLNRGKESLIATDAQWIASKGSLTADQKDNRYRFLFEESISGSTLSIPVEGGKLNTIGNPFMSHIDFERFVNDNQDKIQGYYRIWDGTKFYLYITDKSANALWSGLGGLTTETTDNVITQYIAPLQSFFVEVKAGVTSLDFKADNILGSNTLSKLRSIPTAANLLQFELRMNGLSSRAFVGVRDGASTAYDASEDIKKLFAPSEYTPEVYTIAGKESIELNMIGSEVNSQEIGLGIRTNQTGNLEIVVSGVEDFDAYNRVLLKDNVSGQIYDLKKTSTIKISKTTKDNIETRFSLLFAEAGSSIDEQSVSGGVVITDKQKELEIETTEGSLQSVELFDAAGLLRVKADQINSQNYVLAKRNFANGVYVVRVTCESGVKTAKVVF